VHTNSCKNYCLCTQWLIPSARSYSRAIQLNCSRGRIDRNPHPKLLISCTLYKTDRHTDRERQTDTHTHRQRERDRQTDTHTHRQTDRERETDTKTERETHTHTDRERVRVKEILTSTH